MNRKLLAASIGVLFLCFAGASMATLYTIPLERGISFQDTEPSRFEVTLTHDDTEKLMAVDGNSGPSVVGSVAYDYYATGTSAKFFDAVSLSFDLSPVEYLSNVHSVDLRLFVQTGDYAVLDPVSGADWHHYQVLPGAFNAANEDVLGPAFAAGAVSSFDYDQYTNGGWIEAAIDPAWIAGEEFDVTLRLWNARLDAVELAVTNSLPGEQPVNSVPEPATMLLVGLGLIGVAGFSRRKIKR